MGASLSVNLTQTDKNETARTATVSVVVTITSTAGTHNNYGSSTLGQGALLYVTVDGSTYETYVTFGSESTGTYTTTVYSNSFIVSYGSSGTKTVSVRARCITGTSAGTISGSNSLSLTPISASSGSGGSSGSSGDYDNSEEYTGPTVTPNPGGIELVPGNATVQDQYGRDMVYYSWDGTAIVGYDFHLTYGSLVSSVVVIRFTTPKFTGTSKTVCVALETLSSTNNKEIAANIALCRSDSNRNNYVDAGSTVTDSNQIAVGNITLAGGSFCYAEISTTALESETDYYLIIWSPSKSPVAKCQLANANNHAINIEWTELSVCHIHNGTKYVAYQCHIHNGTKYDAYQCYIDNGTGWDLVGEM